MDATTTSAWAPEALNRSFVPSAAPRWGFRAGRRAAVLAWLGSGLVATLLLTVAAVLVLRSLPPPGRIGPEAYGRVMEGMDRAQVEKAIGLPPGDYRDRAHKPGGRAFTEWSEEAAGEEFGGAAEDRLQWQGNDFSISAGFDEAGRVTWKTLWHHVPPPPRGPADELQRRLGW